jgi:hypothetical protein
MGKKSGSGSGIRIWDEKPGLYFSVLRNNVLGLKQNKFFEEDPESKKIGSRIRDKHPGSATLRFKINFHTQRKVCVI